MNPLKRQKTTDDRGFIPQLETPLISKNERIFLEFCKNTRPLFSSFQPDIIKLEQEITRLVDLIVFSPSDEIEQAFLSDLIEKVQKIGCQDLARKVMNFRDFKSQTERVWRIHRPLANKLEDTWIGNAFSFKNTSVSPTVIGLEINDFVDISFKDLVASIELEYFPVEFTYPIIQEIMNSITEGRAPNFSFLETNIALVHLLFDILNRLSLEAYQKVHLEPFQIKFRSIPLESIPKTVQCLTIRRHSPRYDLSCFFHLKTLSMLEAVQIGNTEFNEIPELIKSRIESLTLQRMNVSGFDFSLFENLKTLELVAVEDLTAAQFNQLPQKVKKNLEKLELRVLDVRGFDFSEFQNLKILSLAGSKNLTAAQFNSLPRSSTIQIEQLNLNEVDVAEFDFSDFRGLKILRLSQVRSLTTRHLDAIPVKTTIKLLDLEGSQLTGEIDLDQFSQAEIWH